MREAAVQPAGQPPVGVAEQVHHGRHEHGAQDERVQRDRLGGCAFAGAVLVALNPVRRGPALARDVARTDFQYVLAEPQYAALLPAMDVPVLPFDGLELPGQARRSGASLTPAEFGAFPAGQGDIGRRPPRPAYTRF